MPTTSTTNTTLPTLAALTLCALFLTPTSPIASAAPGFIPIAQNRQTLTGAVISDTINNITLDSDEQLDEPFDFGPWTSNITSSADAQQTTANANATQNSAIDTLLITAAGTATIDLSPTTPNTSAQSAALSAFATFFTISQPTLITLDAAIANPETAFFIFEGPTGILAELSPANPNLNISTQLLLIPGNYALNAAASLNTTIPPNTTTPTTDTTNFNLTLAVVPAPTTPLILTTTTLPLLTRRRRPNN
ncbi:MAG: hypothetical protein ACTS3F_12370 [Phycisphaerales bacterium]